MAENNPAKKTFEAGARTAREALEQGTATAELAAREAEHSYSSAGEGFRDFNARLIDIAQANTMASLNFLAELAQAKGPTEAFELWSRHAQEPNAKTDRAVAGTCDAGTENCVLKHGAIAARFRSNTQTRFVTAASSAGDSEEGKALIRVEFCGRPVVRQLVKRCPGGRQNDERSVRTPLPFGLDEVEGTRPSGLNKGSLYVLIAYGRPP